MSKVSKAQSVRVKAFVDKVSKDKPTSDAIADACKDEMIFIFNRYKTIESRGVAFTPYRNALRQVDKKHPALRHMRLSKKDAKEKRAKHHKSISARLDNTNPALGNDYKAYVALAIKLLGYTSYVDRALGVIALTGRRSGEVLSTGALQPVKGNKLAAYFTGQLKGLDPDLVYEIPLLADFDLINDAILLLRKELPDLAKNRELATSRFTGRGCKKAKKHFSKWLGDKATPKVLRRAYAFIAYIESEDSKTTAPNRFFAKVLGHGENDNSTSLSYLDFFTFDLKTQTQNAITGTHP